jgi:hypothetical protein
MTSPVDRTTAQPRTQTDPWVERDVAPLAKASRLHAEQPEAGLLWVLAGRVVVQHREQFRDVRPGTVVSYRLGDPLAWTAPEGALVRWSGRPVKLAAGEVASWTANLAVEVPTAEEEVAAVEPRRRGIYATAAIAATWVVALTVAWCYHHAQSDVESGAVRRAAPATPVPGALAAEERTARARAAEAIFAEAGHAQPAAVVPVSRKSNSVYVNVVHAVEEDVPTAAYQSAVDATFAKWPDVGLVRVVLVDGSPWAQVVYERGSHAVTDFRDGR